MLERMIERHKKELERLKSQGANPSTGARSAKSQIEYVEKAIKNYEEQLARLKSQAEEIKKE